MVPIPVPAITIDPTTLGPYLEQKFKKWRGTDKESVEIDKWFRTLQDSSLQLSSIVHCVGMAEAIPFERLYQPTRLTKKGRGRNSGTYAYNSRLDRAVAHERAQTAYEITLEQFLQSKDDAIIYAGPGWGKTTFLHFLFRKLIWNKTVLPVLITLRRPNAIEDLERIVAIGYEIGKKADKDELILLVDGYDEVDLQGRKRVSDALLKFQSSQIGRYYLTCRSFYAVSLLTAPEVQLKGFLRQDKYAFVETFLRIFGSKLDAVETVDGLEQRGFADFLSHPLLLTLACIVETTSQRNHPRSAIRLLERALEVLAYRWDDQKLIERQKLTSLDGRDRIDLLKRIAYTFQSPFVRTLQVNTIVKAELASMHFDRVDENRVLLETAQFYGILIPTEGGWEFVHRSLQDFLAAQHWVETGKFAEVTTYSWNSRTAYAACLFYDATAVILAGLRDENALATVAEIFSNSAYFSFKDVAAEIFHYFSQDGRATILGSDLAKFIIGQLSTDFFRLADSKYLNRLAEACAMERTPTNDLIAGYCALEICHRRLRFDHVTYSAMCAGYGSEDFHFDLLDAGNIKLLNTRPLGS
jgi:hypothetical protein